MWDLLESWCNSCCDPITETVFSDLNDIDDDQNVKYKSTDYFFDACSIVQSSVSSLSASDREEKPLPLQSISFRSTSFSNVPLDVNEREESPVPYDERRSGMEHDIGDTSSWNDTASFMTPRQENDEGSLSSHGDDLEQQRDMMVMMTTSASSEEELPFDESFMAFGTNVTNRVFFY